LVDLETALLLLYPEVSLETYWGEEGFDGPLKQIQQSMQEWLVQDEVEFVLEGSPEKSEVLPIVASHHLRDQA
jgi:hypothetical protein